MRQLSKTREGKTAPTNLIVFRKGRGSTQVRLRAGFTGGPYSLSRVRQVGLTGFHPTCFVEEGYFPEILLDFANAHQIDLIVLGLRSPEPYVERPVWQHAYDIVCHARSPVLTLRSARR